MKTVVKITRDNLYSIIRETVKKALLTEENSINRDVEMETMYIGNIISCHKYTDNEIVEKNDKYIHYSTSLTHSFLNCNVDYTFHYFEFFDGIHRELTCYSISSSNKSASVHIEYDLEDGPLAYGDLFDSIQHELTHILKLKYPLAKDKKYHSKASKLINATNYFFNSDEPMKRKIGLIFYLGLNDEQDTFMDKLYTSMKQNMRNGTMPNETIKKSQLMAFIDELIDIRDNIDYYFANEEFIGALKEFKLHSKYKRSLGKNGLVRKINYTLNRINAKFYNIARAYKTYLLHNAISIRGDINFLVINSLF